MYGVITKIINHKEVVMTGGVSGAPQEPIKLGFFTGFTKCFSGADSILKSMKEAKSLNEKIGMLNWVTNKGTLKELQVAFMGTAQKGSMADTWKEVRAALAGKITSRNIFGRTIQEPKNFKLLKEVVTPGPSPAASPVAQSAAQVAVRAISPSPAGIGSPKPAAPPAPAAAEAPAAAAAEAPAPAAAEAPAAAASASVPPLPTRMEESYVQADLASQGRLITPKTAEVSVHGKRLAKLGLTHERYKNALKRTDQELQNILTAERFAGLEEAHGFEDQSKLEDFRAKFDDEQSLKTLIEESEQHTT